MAGHTVNYAGELMSQDRFLEIDKRISLLLQKSAGYFSMQELQEVQAFLDVDEYGLALETYVCLARKHGAMTADSFHEVELLIHAMEMEGEDIDLDSFRT